MSDDNTLHKLQERVKELTALHKTAWLLQDDARPSREVVRDVVAILPQAWQYPDIAEARITFQEIDEQTPGFRNTEWMQSATFTARADIHGTIEIAYREARSPADEGSFLKEERDLIESLSEMLRSYFQHKLADQATQEAYDNLEKLVSQRTEELQRINRDLEREVAEHQRARRIIEESQARLRRLAAELSLSEARKQREIAVDLHDHVIQEFAFIKLRILEFRGDAVFCGFERNFEEIIALLERAIQHTRQLTFEISTPILYELGLPAALEWLAEQYENRHRLSIRVKQRGVPTKIPEAIRVTLFKCVQELLTNAVKYAQAKRVQIRLTSREQRLNIEVADDGVGFDARVLEAIPPSQSGFGLFSIRERLQYFGGSMTVQSAPGSGTTITLSVPLEK
ncbi:MAG: ATP-binding protein [Calditrichota bacterium]